MSDYTPTEQAWFDSADKRANIKRGFLFVLVAVLACALGIAIGHFTAPAKVETREVERVVYASLAVEDITRGFTFARTVEVTRWRNVVTTITDAGTTITDKTIEREGSSETAAATEQIKRVEIVEVEKEKIVERTVTLQPRFRASLLAGATLGDPLIHLTGPLVLGVSFDVRIVGGLWVGAWLNTFGAAGGSLSLEFGS